MKLLIALLVLAFMAISGHAQGLTAKQSRALQVLKKEKIDVNILRKTGHQVLLGELTGAGKSVPLSKLKLLIHNDTVIDRQEIIRVSLNQGGSSLADIQSVVVREQLPQGALDTVINARELIGAISK